MLPPNGSCTDRELNIAPHRLTKELQLLIVHKYVTIANSSVCYTRLVLMREPQALHGCTFSEGPEPIFLSSFLKIQAFDKQSVTFSGVAVQQIKQFLRLLHLHAAYYNHFSPAAIIGCVQQLVITPTLSEACVLNHSCLKQHLKSSQRPQQHMQISFQKIC